MRKGALLMDVVIFTDANGLLGFARYAGAYKVATELRRSGYSVQVVDFFADLTFCDLEKICKKYIDKNTLYVGFSTTLMIKKSNNPLSRIERSEQNKNSGHLPQSNNFIKDLFALIKKINANVKIVMGGGRANITNLPGVDYWLWGFGDVSSVALANHLKFSHPIITRKAQEGLAISDTDYTYNNFSNSKIIWRDNDFIFQNEHLPIEISRGCIYRCAFCANPLHKKIGEYNKDVATIRQEMIYNFEHFSTTGYMFCDDTFNDTHEKVKNLYNMFKKLPFQLEWTGYGRVDSIYSNPEQRDMLLESGLKAMLIGIETLNPATVRAIGKGLHPEKVKETLYFLKETWKDKITITGSFIVGLPKESEESIMKTVMWLLEKDNPIDDVTFNPLNIRITTDNPDSPLSRIAKNPESFGYVLSKPSLHLVSTHGPEWQNEYMTKTYAENLTKEIQSKFHPKNPMGDWALYSRMRNLGYTREELAKQKSNDSEFKNEANARRDNLRKEYLKKLLR